MKNWLTSILFMVGFLTLFVGGQGSLQLLESWRLSSSRERSHSEISTSPHRAARLGQPKGSVVGGGPPAVKTSPAARAALVTVRERFDELTHCLESRDCFQFFQQDDGKLGYHYAVSNEVVKVAAEIEPLVESGEVAVDQELILLVHQLLQFPEDHVRDVALRLVPHLPKSPQTLQVALGALRDSASAPLYSLGLKVMKNYADNPSDTRVFSEFLADRLLHGGPNISEEVAKNLFPLLNASNIQLFQGVLTKMPERSPASSYLESGIKEYEIITAGY